MLIMSAGWPGYGGNVRRKKKSRQPFFFCSVSAGSGSRLCVGVCVGLWEAPFFSLFFSLCSAQLLVREQDLPHGECSGNSSRRSRDGNAWCKVLLVGTVTGGNTGGGSLYNIVLYCIVCM